MQRTPPWARPKGMRLTDNPRRDIPICAGVVVILTLIFWPVTACGCGSPAAACLSDLKQQALGIQFYASDHDDRLPLRDAWMDAIAPDLKDEGVFQDPEGPKGGYGYAFNAALSGAKDPPRPERVPMVYDSVNPVRNVSDLVTSLPKPGRHHGKDNVAYADGHARSMRMP